MKIVTIQVPFFERRSRLQCPKCGSRDLPTRIRYYADSDFKRELATVAGCACGYLDQRDSDGNHATVVFPDEPADEISNDEENLP